MTTSHKFPSLDEQLPNEDVEALRDAGELLLQLPGQLVVLVLEAVGLQEAVEERVEAGLEQGAAGQLADGRRQLDQVGDGNQRHLLGAQRNEVVL